MGKMHKRSVHIYARGRGFLVVPVCPQPDGLWLECQPAREISLTPGYATTVYLGRAIDAAASQPSDDDIQPWDGSAGGWWEHHLLAVRVTWDDSHTQLLRLPNLDVMGNWPANFSREKLAGHIIAALGQALA